MDVVVHEDEVGKAVIQVSGELDVHTAGQLRQAVTTLIAQERHDLVVDLTNVGFLDSTGLGVLVGALKKTRQHGGSVRLTCAEGPALRVLRSTGLTKVFPVAISA